jgi:hypothetical protein
MLLAGCATPQPRHLPVEWVESGYTVYFDSCSKEMYRLPKEFSKTVIKLNQ